MEDRKLSVVAAIVCLSLLECAAIIAHEDGAFFLPIVAVISGLAGYQIPMIQGKTTVTRTDQSTPAESPQPVCP